MHHFRVLQIATDYSLVDAPSGIKHYYDSRDQMHLDTYSSTRINHTFPINKKSMGMELYAYISQSKDVKSSVNQGHKS
jgi:hypothetical protein